MPFHETQTLTNEDSKIRIDVETMARIEMSDIEYLQEKISNEKDNRLVRIMYETAITKLSTVFQLVMKSCKYLEQLDYLSEVKELSKKPNSKLGSIKKFREDLFHDGVGFIQKNTFYPIGKINGRGFVAIRVHLGATLRITGICNLEAKNSEFVVTSEGIFEIRSPSQADEKWILIDKMPIVSAVNYDETNEIILASLSELKSIWNKLQRIRQEGNGKHSYTYLNEGSEWALKEKVDGKLKIYSANSKSIEVKGDLTITPPNIRVNDNKVIYE